MYESNDRYELRNFTTTTTTTINFLYLCCLHVRESKPGRGPRFSTPTASNLQPPHAEYKYEGWPNDGLQFTESR